MEKPKLELKITDFGPAWLVGCKTTVQQGKTAEKFVQEFRQNGSNESLQNLDNRVSPKGDIIIWMGDYDGESKSFVEIPGVIVSHVASMNDDYTIRELRHCTMGICTITGKTRNLSRGAHNKLVKLLKESGYEPDYSFGYSMEYYSYEKYEKENVEYEFSYLLPCKPR